jgi:hypothetical protein
VIRGPAARLAYWETGLRVPWPCNVARAVRIRARISARRPRRGVGARSVVEPCQQACTPETQRRVKRSRLPLARAVRAPTERRRSADTNGARTSTPLGKTRGAPAQTAHGSYTNRRARRELGHKGRLRRGERRPHMSGILNDDGWCRRVYLDDCCMNLREPGARPGNTLTGAGPVTRPRTQRRRRCRKDPEVARARMRSKVRLASPPRDPYARPAALEALRPAPLSPAPQPPA